MVRTRESPHKIVHGHRTDPEILIDNLMLFDPLFRERLDHRRKTHFPSVPESYKLRLCRDRAPDRGRAGRGLSVLRDKPGKRLWTGLYKDAVPAKFEKPPC